MEARYDPDGTPLVPSLCVKCLKPVRIWGGWYYGRAEPDGHGGWRAPIARMWGGYYTHGDCSHG